MNTKALQTWGVLGFLAVSGAMCHASSSDVVKGTADNSLPYAGLTVRQQQAQANQATVVVDTDAAFKEYSPMIFGGVFVHNSEANLVVDIPFQARKSHANSFIDVNLDVVFTDPEGTQMAVPGFWVGKDQWKVRYASVMVGTHRFRTQCSDTEDTGLHGIEGQIRITPYAGKNPLYRHGPCNRRRLGAAAGWRQEHACSSGP